MSVKRLTRILECIDHGNSLLRELLKKAPTPMTYPLQECLNHYEFVALMTKDSLDVAKTHKAKALEGRL